MLSAAVSTFQTNLSAVSQNAVARYVGKKSPCFSLSRWFFLFHSYTFLILRYAVTKNGWV